MTRVIICANGERIDIPRFIALRLIKEGKATLAPPDHVKRDRVSVRDR